MSTQYMTDIGAAVLIKREGSRLKAYKDSVGVWTIGIGHTGFVDGKPVAAGMTITEAKQKELFFQDLASHAKPVFDAIKVPLLPNQKDAIASIAFNIGVKGASTSSFVRLINARASNERVAQAMMLWSKPKVIIPRRRAEVNQFFTPYDVAMPTQTADDILDELKVASHPQTSSPAAPAASPNPKPPAAGWAEDKLPEFEVKAIQQRLIDLGYHIVGLPDGTWGEKTTAAIKMLQEQANKRDPAISTDGHYGPQTKALLADPANKVEIPAERGSITAKDLAAVGNPAVIKSQKIVTASWGSILSSVGAFAVALAQQWQTQPDVPWYGNLLMGFLPPAALPVLVVLFNLYNVAKAQGLIGSAVERVREGIDNSGMPSVNGPVNLGWLNSIFGK